MGTQTTIQIGRTDEYVHRIEFERFNARLSESTKLTYAGSLKMLKAFMNERFNVELGDLQNDAVAWTGMTYNLLLLFQQSLLNAGYSAGATNTRVAGIKTYCRVAHRCGVIPADEYARIRGLAGIPQTRDKQGHLVGSKLKGARKPEPVFLSAEQMDYIMDHQLDSPNGRRDRVLACLLLEHGLRLGELLLIDIERINLEERTFTFYRPKVKITQTHLMTERTFEAIKRFLKMDRPNISKGVLLVGSHKQQLTINPLSRSGTFALVRTFGRMIDCPNLSPHDCRHSWARRAVDAKTDIFALQDGGGWHSPALPARYAEFGKIANINVRLRP